MKGDFSKWQFNEHDNFAGVLHQQGRVLLDQDWNVQTRITNHWQDTAARDTIGPGVAAVPADESEGFKVTKAKVAEDSTAVEVTLSPGRVWADGLLLHLEEPQEEGGISLKATYLDSNPPDRSEGERDAVVLEVWREAVNAFQENYALIETALGGPDTTERMRTAMALRLLRLEGSQACENIRDLLENRFNNRGTLTVSLTAPTEVEDEACPTYGAGGYSGLEHCLYRIEMAHVDNGDPYFKWSRFNGGLVGRGDIEFDGSEVRSITITGNKGAITSCGTDFFYLEVLEDKPEEYGHRRVVYGASATLEGEVLTLGETLLNQEVPTGNVFFRLWCGVKPIKEYVTTDDSMIPLRDGIHLQFSTNIADFYRPGDFWTFPVRVGQTEIDPPIQDQLPEGIRYHRVPLAELHWGDRNRPESIKDCRAAFLPAADWLAAIRPRMIRVFPALPDGESIEVVNGATIDANTLSRGLRVVLDRNVQVEGVGREICEVTLRLPMREPVDVSDAEDNPVIGYQLTVLDATAALLDPRNVRWTPTAPAAAFCRQRLRDRGVPRPFLEDWEVFAPTGIPAACSYQGTEAVELRWETLSSRPHRSLAIARSPLPSSPYYLGLTSQVSRSHGSVGMVFNWQSSESYCLLECSWYWQPVGYSGAIPYTILSLSMVEGEMASNVYRISRSYESTPTEVALATRQYSDGLSMKASVKVRDNEYTIDIDTNTIAGAPRTLLAGTRIGMLASAWSSDVVETDWEVTTRFSRLEVVYPFDRVLFIPPLAAVPASVKVKHRFLPPEETTPTVPQWQPDSEVWFWVAPPRVEDGYPYGYPYGDYGALGLGSEIL